MPPRALLRRTLTAFAVLASLSLSITAAEAYPSGKSAALRESIGLGSWVRGVLTGLWDKTGMMIDPDGGNSDTDAGMMIDPNGGTSANADTGIMIDPNGSL